MMPTLHLAHINHTQIDPTTWCMTAQVSAASLAIDSKDLWNHLSWVYFSNSAAIGTIKLNHIDWHYRNHNHKPKIQPSARRVAHTQRQQQRQGVRKLLQELLKKLNICDTLDESSFPYRLSSSQYYVCFSHTSANSKNNTHEPSSEKTAKASHSKIAVVISRHRPAGIDIETSNIAWHVVTRFYSDNEIALLQVMPTTQRDAAAKLLWQIKESLIKINQYTLAQGLGKDYAYLIPYLSNSGLSDFSLSGSDLSTLGLLASNVCTDSLDNATIEPTSPTENTAHQTPYRISVLQAQQTVIIF